MIERRLLAGLALGAAALVFVATAPGADAQTAASVPAAGGPPVRGARVTSRAESPLLAQSSALPSPSAEPEPSGIPASMPSPETAARARAVFEENRSGHLDRSHYTARQNARMTDAALADASAKLKALGPIKSVTQVRKITQGAFVAYVFQIECERPPAIEEVIEWNAAGQIEYLAFGPAEH